MTRLIMPLLRRQKVWIPMTALALLLVLVGLWILLLPFILAMALLLAIHFSPRIVFSNFCQDVWASESELLLQLREEQIRLPLEHIEKITYHSSNNPPRAKITLKSANQFGSVFTFIPDLSGGRRQAKKNIEMLNARLDQ